MTEFKSELRKKCVFPFILSDDNNQVRLENCTTILDPEGRTWCSTKKLLFTLKASYIVCLSQQIFAGFFNFKVCYASQQTYIRKIKQQSFKMSSKLSFCHQNSSETFLRICYPCEAQDKHKLTKVWGKLLKLYSHQPRPRFLQKNTSWRISNYFKVYKMDVFQFLDSYLTVLTISYFVQWVRKLRFVLT